MIMNKRVFLFISLIFFLLSNPIIAQDKFEFPDIPGYKTLICDFHMHTVFSDGLVWPSVRVDEAVEEGLDAISITEHVEYINSYLRGDHNQSFKMAKPRADKKDLMLIRGAEITRDMPPGHFNALFIEDANPLDTSDWKAAIRLAIEQGAYVFWNHPGWRQPEEIPIWYKEHSWLLSKGWIQGMEIVNENSYYPLVHQWCVDSNLTLLGNSDIHDPIDKFFDKCIGEHRPVTLVFTEERSEQGIRKAMDERRTAVYYKDLLIGSEEYVKPLFEASIDDSLVRVSMGGNEDPAYIMNNSSCFTFEIVYVDMKGVESDPVFLSPGYNESKFRIFHDYPKVIVKNVLVAPGVSLEITN